MPLLDDIRGCGLFLPDELVLCALSGGPDSVCMTHALCSLREELHIKVAAAHFSHGLRPEKAESERELCRKLCDSLGIPLYCGAGDTRAFASAQKLGTEEAARRLRYAFLEETADSCGASRIATAHTQNDQAETVLFHLIRGGGARGLSGIPARRGRYIRPLLGTGRAEVMEYLSRQGLTAAEDESNKDLRYSRNRLRGEALPLLERIHPGALKSISSAASLLAADDDCLQRLADRLIEGNGASASAVAAAHPSIGGRAVQALYRAAGGKADLYRRQTEDVLHLCATENPSMQLSLPGGFIARREYDKLMIIAAADDSDEQPLPETALPFNEPVRFGEWEVTAFDPEGDGFSFPKEAIVMPLAVRTRKTGDRISLQCGTRSLKKWMIDQKIPKNLRERLPVVCDARQVLAVAGYVKAALCGQGEKISISCRRITL